MINKSKRILSLILAVLMIISGINLTIPAKNVEAVSLPNRVTLNPIKYFGTPSYTIKKTDRVGGYGAWTSVGRVESTAEQFQDGKNVLFCIEVWNNVGWYNGSNPKALEYTAYGSPQTLERSIAEFIQYTSYTQRLQTWEEFKQKYMASTDGEFSNLLQLAVWQLKGQIEVDKNSYTGKLLSDYWRDINGLKNPLKYDVKGHKWKEGVNVIKNTGSGAFSKRLNENPTFTGTNGVTGKIALNGDLTINVPKSALSSGFSFNFYHPRIKGSTLVKQEYRNEKDGQRLIAIDGGWDRWDFYKFEVEPQTVPLKLKKESTKPSYVEGNPNYSLEGAEYGLYKNEVNATRDQNRLGTFTSDKNGNTNSIDLAKGTYYVKETKAPKGYKLDDFGGENKDGIYKIEIVDKPVTFNVKDEPKTDPLSLMLKKTDENGKGIVNAEFEIKYYQELTDNVEGLTPKYTWKFKTDEDGHLSFLEEYRIGGDEIPKDENGIEVGFIGTYTIQETKAPKGYKLDDTLYIKQLREGTRLDVQLVFNAPTHENKSQLMQFTLKKKDVVTTQSQGNATLEGAKYKVVLVESKYTDIKSGTIVKEVVTNKDGVVSVKDLPLGVYDVVEVENSLGYTLNPVAVRVEGVEDDLGGEYTTKVTQTTTNSKTLIDMLNSKIDELNILNKANANGGEYREIEHIKDKEFNQITSENPTVITNELVEMGRISVTKHQDGENGKDNSSQSGGRIPEEGIKFDIYNLNDEKVDSFTTDKFGRGTSKWLPKGIYIVKQASRNHGFINVEPFKVEIKGDWTEYQYNLENYSNEKWLQIFKKDEETGNTIPQSGVKFELYKANEDGSKGEKVVQTLRYQETKEISEFETNDKGMVQLPEKIQVGKYILEEIKAPKGYYLDPQGEPLQFEIEDDGDKPAQLTKIFVIEKRNTPQKGRLTLEKTAPILKGFSVKDGVTKLEFKDGYLEGTKWELRAKEDIISGDKVTILHKKGELVDTITTNSKTPVISKEVPLGKYTLKEISVPDKYVLDTREYDIEFTPQSQNVRVHSVTEMKFNERKNIEFEFTKKFENDPYFTTNPKAEFGIFLADDYKENGVTIPKDSMLDKVEVEAKELNGEKKVEKPVYEIVEKEVNRYEVSEFIETKVDNKDKPIIETKKEVSYELTYKVPSTNEVVSQEYDTKEKAQEALGEAVDRLKEDIKDYNIKEIVKETKEVTGYEQKTITKLVEVFKFNEEEKAKAKIEEIEAKGNIAKLEVIKTKVEEKVQVGVEETKEVEYVIKGKFNSLPIDGKFYIKELSVDGKYVLDNKKHETGFKFEDTKEKENKVESAEIENELQKVSVVIVKTEMGSNKEIPVVGAKYKLVAVDEIKGKTEVGEYITDKLGKIVVEGLPKGQYYLEEVKAPEGYIKDDKNIDLDLSNKDHGDVVEVEHENEKIPHIKTTAEDKNTGKKNINPTQKVYIKDYAYYKDLNIGKEYEIKGLLMDKSTNKPLLDKNGRKYETSLKFVPETRKGYVVLEFEVDSSDIRGKTTVVFEDLYREGRLLYSHADINDEDQTVKVKDPKIKTTFAEIKSGKKVFDPVGVVKLVDKVYYENLVIGDEYVAKLKVMDKETNKPLLINGKEVVSETRFIAEKETGVVEVTVEIDLSQVRGKDLVAFEKLLYNGEVIATHEDINDEGQTVKVNDIPKILKNPKTGDLGILLPTTLLSISSIILLFFRRKQRQLNK